MNEESVYRKQIKPLEESLAVNLGVKWWVIMIEGIMFLLLGMLSTMVPRLFSVIDVDILGWILVIGGTTQMGRALYLSKMPGAGKWLSISILQILAGYVLILKPDIGVITITSLIALFFAYEGSIKIYLAVTEKELPNNKMMLFSGLTSLVFALVMVSFWPEIEHWILGLLLGINMLILGATLVKYGFFLRRNRI